MADFKFEIFISYSNRDDAWGRKLYHSLVAKGIAPDAIFIDKEYLKPGVAWKPTMSNAVLNARHLIALWSNNARASDWVSDELSKFTQVIDPEGKGRPREDRKLIFIPLEGENKVYEHYQWVNDLKNAGAYDAAAPDTGIGNLDVNVWEEMVGKVVSAVTSNPDFSPIMLSVLAMTKDRVDHLNLKALLPTGDTLADAVKKMGMLMDVGLLDRLDPNMLVGVDNLTGASRTLAALLGKLNVATEADPDDPRAVKILLPDGDSLAAALRRRGIDTLTQLFAYVEQNPNVPLPNGQPLDAVLNGLWMLPSEVEHLLLKVALRDYYGESPLDWRPFGSPEEKISTIMAHVKSEFNKELVGLNMHDRRIRWQLVEDFWSDTNEARGELEKLARKKSVIVLDPLSLYDSEIGNRIQMLFGAFENDQALILAFAPFELPTPSGVMRKLIRHRAYQFFKSFYEPDLSTMKNYAKCGPDVGDVADINRWLRIALKPQTTAAKSSQEVAETAALRT